MSDDDSPSDWTPNFGNISEAAPPWPAKKPLRIAILGDFGAGALNGRLDDAEALGKRKPLKVEADTLDNAIARLKLSLKLPLGADGAAVDVDIEELESFHPDELYRQVEVFSALSGLRKKLNNPATFKSAANEINKWGGGGKVRASRVARRGAARGAAPRAGAKLDDFARLVGRNTSVDTADAGIDALLRNIVGPFVVPAPDPKKEALLATVDSALTDAMRAVLHQGDFQNTESLWRGVDFLLRRLETSRALQVHLFDISAEELAADLSRQDDLSESGLYQLLVSTPSQDADGGYTYIAGCYHFEATPPHAELLGRAARVAAQAGAPFLTGIATDPFANRREPPHKLVSDAFAALRELPEAARLGLFGPRFLLRHPYGKRSDPIQSFAFEEFTRAAGLRGMLWGHPALLALAVLATPGGQPVVNDLAFHHYADDDGDSTALPCTDRLINTNVATLLRDFGINGVMAHKGEPLVRLSGLLAVNGEALAAAGAVKPKTLGDRVAIGGKPGSAESSGSRGGSSRRADDDEDDDSDKADRDDSDSSDDDMKSLLSGLDDDSGGSSGDSGGDDDLAALLAKMDSSSDESSSSADSAGSDDETEPDLDALLKSLS